jgi:5'-methylthioadenosine phosphorylase
MAESRDTAMIAVLGGSGFYSMPGLADVKEYEITTPFGLPSDKIVIGTLSGARVAFLARHGVGHRILPQEVPSRANMWALKSLGVKWIISVSACGSLQEKYSPGDLVIPDGLFDRTSGRQTSFFGEGVVAHVSLADPFCPILSDVLVKSCEEATKGTQKKVYKGAKLIVIDGPRFSTKTESHIFRSWGLDLINMTTMPEAILAREAEMAYAVINCVTDYDCWHESDEPVTVDKVIQVLLGNVEVAQSAVAAAVKGLTSETRESPCWSALKDAIMTKPELVPIKVRKSLDLITGKYWPAAP